MNREEGARGQTGMVTGIVHTISVSGIGAASFEIVATITVNGTDETYAVYSDSEPAIFSAFVSILNASHLSQTKIDLHYENLPGKTPAIYQLDFPSATP